MEPLSALFLALADVYSEEGRFGGDQASIALRCASRKIDEPKQFNNGFSIEIQSALKFDDHTLTKLVLEASPFIKWGGAELRKDRMPEKLANKMPMCELVGPDGLYFDENVRVGLWLQTKGVTYGPRRHEAEETFYTVSGEAEWWTELTGADTKGVGTYVHHPSNVQHKSTTFDNHVLALWRWSGEIGFDKYALHGN